MKQIEAFLIDKPLFVPFASLGVILVVLTYFAFGYWQDNKYTQLTGTVCCLSEKYHVEASPKRHPYKMMIVELDDGRKVNVPIIDVPYVKGRRIVVTEVKNNGSTFTAVRYN